MWHGGLGLECLDAAPVPGRQAFHGRALLGPRRVMCAVCVCYSLGHYPLFHLLSFFLPFLFLSPIHPQLTIPPPPRLQPPTASNSDNTLYTNHLHTSFLLFSASLLFITISCIRIPPKQDPTRYSPETYIEPNFTAVEQVRTRWPVSPLLCIPPRLNQVQPKPVGVLSSTPRQISLHTRCPRYPPLHMPILSRF